MDEGEAPTYQPGAGLPPEAFEEIDGDRYPPVVPASVSGMPELSLKSVLFGVFIAIAFGAANAYLGLKVGLTVSASIPAAVMAVAFFRLIGGRGSLLEVNMVQTVGSAGESLAAGVIFTLPALFMWGLEPGLLLIMTLSALGGLLGVLFMIPLRRYLIVREHGRLVYPEGTACAQVITTAHRGGAKAKLLFTGLGVGAVYQALASSRFIGLFKSDPEVPIEPLGRNFVVAGEATPELLGVGFIIGPRVSAIMLTGGILGWWVLIPLISHFGEEIANPIYPETVATIAEMSAHDIWSRYVRYIGAGAVAFGGFATLLKSLPTIVASFRHGMEGLRARDSGGDRVVRRTQRDLDFRFVAAAALAIAVVITLMPRSLVPLGIGGALAVLVFAFFFVTVSSRIVGLVGSSSNPVSGMTIATLLITSTAFVVLGRPEDPGAADLWADVTKVGVLGVGALVCMAAAVAGDTSQDLKTGFLVGATPRNQQIGEIIGVLAAASVMGFVLLILNEGYGFGEGGELSAPQATLMKLVVEGILGGDLNWNLILVGVFIGLGVELLGLPTLALAVGLYLPLALTVPIMAGGAIRWWVERRAADGNQKEQRRERGVLFASGLIAGAALVGVVVGGLVFAADFPNKRYDCVESDSAGATPTACVAAFEADLIKKRDAVAAAEAAQVDAGDYLSARRADANEARAATTAATGERVSFAESVAGREVELESSVAEARRLHGAFKMAEMELPDGAPPDGDEDPALAAARTAARAAEIAWLRAEKRGADIRAELDRDRLRLVELIAAETAALEESGRADRALAGAEATTSDLDINELRVNNAAKKLDDARARLSKLEALAPIARQASSWSCFDITPDLPGSDGAHRALADFCSTGGGWLYSIQALTHGSEALAATWSYAPDLAGTLAFAFLVLLLGRAAIRRGRS